MESRIALCGRFARRGIVGPALVFALLAAGPAPAQTVDIYPNRPVRIVVPAAAGSAIDIIARVLQPSLEKALGQSIIVDNRSGATMMIGIDAVAKAAPDGYTLLVATTTFTVTTALGAKLPYDLERDLQPVTLLVKNPLLFAINAKVPAHTVAEFVAQSKAEPGKFNYGTPGAASQAHLLIEMWSARAGVKMQHIPYRGGGPAAVSVATGETQLGLLSPVALQPHLQSGAVRPLATGDLVRDAQFDKLPTMADSGFPGFQAVQWVGLLTTGRTPKAIVEKLNVAFNRALRDPDVTAKLGLQGTTPAGSSPEEFRDLITTEIRNWKDVARTAKIEVR